MTEMSSFRVACVSDTHLRHWRGLPLWCLRRLEGADLIVHAGDLVALPVLEQLERLAPLLLVSLVWSGSLCRRRYNCYSSLPSLFCW